MYLICDENNIFIRNNGFSLLIVSLKVDQVHKI